MSVITSYSIHYTKLYDWTAFVIFIVVIGGIGTLPGPILGVIVFYALERLLADYVV